MVTKHVQSVRQKLQDAKTQASTYNSREALFDLDITEYHILGNIERVFEPYETLWNTSKNWIEREGQLYTDSFTKINGEEIEDDLLAEQEGDFEEPGESHKREMLKVHRALEHPQPN